MNSSKSKKNSLKKLDQLQSSSVFTSIPSTVQTKVQQSSVKIVPSTTLSSSSSSSWSSSSSIISSQSLQNSAKRTVSKDGETMAIKSQSVSVSSSKSLSTKSSSSDSSVTSVGIGRQSDRQSSSFIVPYAAQLRFRLMPEGSGNNLMNIYDHHVFDCVVFIIYCKEHRQLALTSTVERHRMYCWFPFVLIHDVFTWDRISRDGLAIILGKSDAEMDPTLAMLPEYKMTPVNIIKIQVPQTGRYYMRLVQNVLVTGVGKDKKKQVTVQCCVNTNRIRWTKIDDILGGGLTNMWGNEIKFISQTLANNDNEGIIGYNVPKIYPEFLSEHPLQACVPFSNTSDEWWHLFKQIHYSQHRIFEIYEDFLHHLYPALGMTINSFQCFMWKYNLLKQKDKRLEKIFDVFLNWNPSFSSFLKSKSTSEFTEEIKPVSHFLTFQNFVLGLACMDPRTENRQPTRISFIYNYYNTERNNQMTFSQLAEMLVDIFELNPSTNSESVQNQITRFMEYAKMTAENIYITFEQFSQVVIQNGYPSTNQLLRMERNYFEAKKMGIDLIRVRSSSASHSSRKKSKGSQRRQKKSTKSSKQSLQTTSSLNKKKNLCRNHEVKKFDYGLHAVTFDTAGRCVDPRIISDTWITRWSKREMSPHRFSIENVFRVNSFANIFIDLVRDFTENQLMNASNDEMANIGLLASEEELDTLFLYLEILCEQVLAIIRNESKILKLTPPVYIIGDIQGSLIDLLQIESYIFRSVPVLPCTYLFLGNYAGYSFSHGLECVIYLFALKVAMPNSIYLLRGRYELRQYNKNNLEQECRVKYGEKYGEKIYELINRVYDVIPVAATIDESILCVHSGIPRMSAGEKLVPTITSAYSSAAFTEIPNPEQIMPIAFELIVNIPTVYAGEKDEPEEKETGFTPHADFHYYNKSAFLQFIRGNEFEFLIRSHNPCKKGYALCFDNRCLTVYSTSRSGQTNLPYCGICLIDDHNHKIRFITIPVNRNVSAGGQSNNNRNHNSNKLQPPSSTAAVISTIQSQSSSGGA